MLHGSRHFLRTLPLFCPLWQNHNLGQFHDISEQTLYEMNHFNLKTFSEFNQLHHVQNYFFWRPYPVEKLTVITLIDDKWQVFNNSAHRIWQRNSRTETSNLNIYLLRAEFICFIYIIEFLTQFLNLRYQIITNVLWNTYLNSHLYVLSPSLSSLSPKITQLQSSPTSEHRTLRDRDKFSNIWDITNCSRIGYTCSMIYSADFIIMALKG